MCTNYAPVQGRLLLEIFGVEPPREVYKDETWPDYIAPILRARERGERDCVTASFGMVPRHQIPPGAKRYDTTNARAETVGQRPTFSGPWKAGQLCLVPMTAFYEPNYEAGPKSVRYKIWLPDEPAFAVAGLWRAWPNGEYSFTMLTINADRHPVMSRMHAPGKEKRSIVIVPKVAWDDWLTCRDPEVARTFLSLPPAAGMRCEPAPIARTVKVGAREHEEDGDPQGTLLF